MDITESDGTQVITFDPTASCGELTPEESCTVTLRVQHDSTTLGGSNLEFTYVATLVESGTDTLDCLDPTFTGGSAISPANNLDFSVDSATVFSRGEQDNSAGQTDATDALDPAEYDEVLLTITLDDDDTCQGAGPETYTVTVVADQSSTPHD